MKLSVEDLPIIVDVLAVGDEQCFVVLRYHDFVRFAAIGEAKHAPDVVSALDVGGEHAFVIISYNAFCQSLLRLQISGEIDEEAYLARHGDVAAAVNGGALRCGAEHYIIQGYLERRMVRFPSSGDSASEGSD